MTKSNTGTFKFLLAKNNRSSVEEAELQEQTKAIFDDIRTGNLSEQDATALSDVKSVYHLRGQVSESDLNAVLNWPESKIKSKDNEYLLELIIGLSKKFPNADFTKISNCVLAGIPGVSLRIAAVLYLASTGNINDSIWREQLGIMVSDPNLLEVVIKWNEVKDNNSLIEKFLNRLTDSNYSHYNPFYYCLICVASLAELRKGPISKERAKELSSLPWIDHLRRLATDKDLESICTWIKPAAEEDLIELCIGIARNLAPVNFITFVKSVLGGEPSISLRISAVLYLASKGHMNSSDWDNQVGMMIVDPVELLNVARYFYGAKDNIELAAAIKKREETGNYTYNQRYYDLLKKYI